MKPYIVLKKNGLRIGVLGVGVNPEGIIQRENYEGMHFLPIINSVNKYAEILKTKEKCDLVVCLSHIGFTSAEGVVNDQILARESRFVDIIIGGHSHTYMETPIVLQNIDKKQVMIYQMGKNGSFVGRIDVKLEEVNPQKEK